MSLTKSAHNRYKVTVGVKDTSGKITFTIFNKEVERLTSVPIENIISEIGQGSISNIDALNIRLENQVPNGGGTESQGVSSQVPAALRNFSLSQKERTLDERVRDKCLCATSDGRIGFGVRSFLDLRSWFRNKDVPACDVCNEAAVKVSLF
ncbi:hypothetical protein AgCh_021769 [Apium graveolens]